MTRLALPTPYLFEIDTPLILFNGRLLQPKDRTEGDDNYAEFNSMRFSLEEVVTPGHLEELYFRHNRTAVESMQESFVQQYFSQQFRSMESLSQSTRQNNVLSLVVEKVLPILTADRLDGRIEDIMREDQPARQAPAQVQAVQAMQPVEVPASVMREVNRIKRQLVGEIEREYEGYSLDAAADNGSDVGDKIQELLRPTSGHSRRDTFPTLRENSVLSELLRNNNLMLINGSIYSLLTARDFLAYFEQGLSRTYFNRTQRFAATMDLAAVAQDVEAHKDQVDHKYLSRIVNKLTSSHLKANSKYYIPFLWGDTSDLVERYRMLLEKKMKTEAIEHSEYQTRELHRIEQERQRLDGIASRSSFERNNAGFLKRQEYYYVFIRTPAYALKSPHFRGPNNYLPFPPAKIGVRIKYLSSRRRDGYWGDDYRTVSSADGNGVFEISEPMMIDGYRHPFVGESRPFYPICLGRWSPHERTRNMSPEQKVLTLLSQAKKTLMMGYRSGSNPYTRLERDRWEGWTTKEEVERQGLVVLNDFGSRGR